MPNELPNLNNMHPQLPMPRNHRSPQETADMLSEYAKACIRIAFWLLAAIISLGVVVGVGVVFARGVLWFIQLSSHALGV